MDDRIRILHVDDDPSFADLTATFLEREGESFVVETAASAGEGIDRLAEGDFDCVVSDYDMPGKNGIEFLESVRNEYADVPFILFTGKGSEEVASDAISAGVTDYLQKEGGSDQYAILANRIRNVVERTWAERERRRQLDAIETAQEGISILNEDGEFIYVNESYGELYGYETDEMVGEHWQLIYQDEDVGRIREEILPGVEETGFWHGETTGLRADGTTFVEDHTLATTANGELVCTVRDVTNQKEYERRLDAIFHNTYTFIGLAEPDGTLIEANQRALSFGGLDREDVVGEPIWEAKWFQASDDTRSTAREAIEQAREGELFRDEVRIQGEEREIVIDLSVKPVTDSGGDVTLLVPEGRDITERKEYMHRLERLIDNVPGIVYRCRNEPGWPMESVRGEVKDLTGYPPSEFEKREEMYGTEVVHPDDQEEVWETVQQTLDNESSFELTYRIVTNDGTTKWVWERGQKVSTSDTVETIDGFITDITGQKRLGNE